MPTIARSVTALTLIMVSSLCMAECALAQYETSCTTKSECDFREDQRADAARREEYARMVSNQEEAHAAAIQARNEAGVRRARDKEDRLQAILQRRRDAYARAHN